MIAELAMYDRPETAASNDRFWDEIRTRLALNTGQAPQKLCRGGDTMQNWLSPTLLFSQTCGLPYRAFLHDKVTLIGTPDYGLPGVAAGFYYSVFITRSDDPRTRLAEFDGARFAYNETLSQSGWAAPCIHAASIGLKFGPCLESGGHVSSARAVAAGLADFAALDAVTWAMIGKWDRFARDLKVIDRTTATPGLPYISAAGADRAALFDATAGAISALSSADREILMLRGIVDIPAEAYLALENPSSN
ncbi:MAG: phosphate/phosphite/phosphonate ABC transporter substrate-binding protein [Halocynthiibacter sp.]